MSVARVGLRVCIGGLLVGHGLQKLKGSFGGAGLEGTEQMMHNIGMHPARQQALAAGLAETIGGGLTGLGLFSPLGPSMIIGVMAVAIHKVHAKRGVWISQGGFEYNLAIIAAVLELAAEGPGKLSIDGIFRHERKGSIWALLALALGLSSAAGAVAIAGRFTPTQDEAHIDDEAEPQSTAGTGDAA